MDRPCSGVSARPDRTPGRQCHRGASAGHIPPTSDDGQTPCAVTWGGQAHHKLAFTAANAATSRADFDERLEANARALVPAVEAELDAHVVALSTLALSPDLNASGDLAAFHERARQIAESFGSRVFVTTPPPESRLMLNTALPFEAGIPPALATDERRFAPTTGPCGPPAPWSRTSRPAG